MIEIKNIRKSFGEKIVLDGINLEIPRGESHAIIGQSGCGKSVLLKIIVALLRPDSGEVYIDGENILTADEKKLFEIRRKFGFLFQGAALFDSLTVEENVAMPLTESDAYSFSEEEIKKLVREKLGLVGLEGSEKLKPSELSGGMQKRVGLARALITNPKFMLYDEPTTGLDPIMSDSIDELIKKLNTQFNVTSIIVTHDMFSVKNVADKISLLHNGKIYFTGSFEEIHASDDSVIKNFIKRTET